MMKKVEKTNLKFACTYCTKRKGVKKRWSEGIFTVDDFGKRLILRDTKNWQIETFKPNNNSVVIREGDEVELKYNTVLVEELLEGDWETFYENVEETIEIDSEKTKRENLDGYFYEEGEEVLKMDR